MKEIVDSFDGNWKRRFDAIRAFSHSVRTSEYHLTNACNIRCKGCWFFEKEFDKPGVQSGRETAKRPELEAFVMKEVSRGINHSLLIGGEPSMFPERISVYVEHMKHVTISTNGYKKLPYEGFESTCIGLSIFGGEKSDDRIRAIRPNGTPFTGLFETALRNYENDDRVWVNYAVTPTLVEEVIPTVRRIIDNGNIVNFNYYHDYSSHTDYAGDTTELYDALMECRTRWPKQIVSHPYYLKTLLSGKSHFGTFGYDTCPSLSVDFPGNQERINNGNRVLPLFNAWAADLKTVVKCCTSGDCESCRDSQAVHSWLISNIKKFSDNAENLKTWIELAESFWAQYSWSDYSLYKKALKPLEAETVVA